MESAYIIPRFCQDMHFISSEANKLKKQANKQQKDQFSVNIVVLAYHLCR